MKINSKELILYSTDFTDFLEKANRYRDDIFRVN